MSPPPASQEDLDSTAELPVLDPPPAAVTLNPDDEHSSTDTWALLPALRPEHDPRRDAALETLAAELRAAQQLLHAKNDRITQLERERDEAHTAGLAADQRARDLGAALERLQSEAAGHTGQVNALTQARVAAEQHAAGVAAELAHLRAGGDADTSDLARLRAAAEQRAARLDGELSRLQAAATQHASQFAELTQARTGAEQRLVALEGELAGLRQQLAAAAERGRGLEARVAEEQKKLADAEARQRQSEAAQADAARARDQHTAGVMADLHLERNRAMAYLESLQTMSSRRSVFEELVVDLTAEAQVRDTDLERISQELARRDARLREQEGELGTRAQRIARLEKDVTEFAAALAERDAQLKESRLLTESQQASGARLQAQLEASGERVRALTAVTEQHTTSESQRKSELSRLLAERVELTAALEQARAGAVQASTQATEHETALRAQRARVSELETALAAEKQRSAQLDGELTAVRAEMEAWGETLRRVHQERGTYQGTLSALEARAQEAERRAAEQLEALNAAQEEVTQQAARIRELEADLTAAEDGVNRLESEARKSGARLEELERAQVQWRETLEQVRHGATDTSANPALREAAQKVSEGAPLPDGATRLLIHTAEGREVVHVLGRKTSVGRTPDNDLQIDAKFISRHHAVILAGPTQTIIEDLNSTNGVHVNGRRVTRQALEDGDTVAIGRQQYRFVVRRSDKR